MKQHTVLTPYMCGEVHCYSTVIEGELVLFDTGPPTPEGIRLLESTVDLKRLKHVFVTHCHIDHYGLAGYLERHTEARIYLARKDVVKLTHADERREGLRELFHEAGFSEELFHKLQESSKTNRSSWAPPTNVEVVEDADVVRKLGIEFVACPGHCQSDLVYLCQGHAISGDLLLRNVFQAPLLELDLDTMKGRFNNYAAYCSSIQKLVALGDLKLCPGHGGYVETIDGTILFYLRKLMQRSEKVKRFAQRETVSEILAELYPTPDPFVTHLKASEVFFMRDFLSRPELLKESLSRIGLFEPVRELYEQVTR